MQQLTSTIELEKHGERVKNGPYIPATLGNASSYRIEADEEGGGGGVATSVTGRYSITQPNFLDFNNFIQLLQRLR